MSEASIFARVNQATDLARVRWAARMARDVAERGRVGLDVAASEAAGHRDPIESQVVAVARTTLDRWDVLSRGSGAQELGREELADGLVNEYQRQNGYTARQIFEHYPRPSRRELTDQVESLLAANDGKRRLAGVDIQSQGPRDGKVSLLEMLNTNIGNWLKNAGAPTTEDSFS